MTQENNNRIQLQGPVCPVPHQHTETVVIGHGSGGQMTRDLIRNIFQTRIGNSILAEGNDAARLTFHSQTTELAVSTDSHVVSPMIYPGGDIGRLAVCGTVNDVAMLGAIPKFLTAAFILEEGLPMQTLNQVIDSMAKACEEADVQIVAGDTKVVEKGQADGIFITTAGIGMIPSGRRLGGQFAQSGDAVLVSGTLGDHAIAILQARGDLGFESEIQSDVAPLNHLINDLLEAVPDVHVLRDPTRGGLATTLVEIACQSQLSIHLEEEAIPVKPEVRVACEMLGFDPLYLANEGKLIVILPEAHVKTALKVIQANPYGAMAAQIGSVNSAESGQVLLKTAFGTNRILSMLSGEILPRIC